MSEYPIAGHSGQPSRTPAPPPPAPRPESAPGGSGITAALGRKLGPMPVWMWGLVAGAALYFYDKYKTPSASTPAATSYTSEANTAPGIDPSTGESYAEEYGAAQEQVDRLDEQAFQPISSSPAAVAAATPVSTSPGAAVSLYGAPSGVTVSGITSSGATISWPALTAPTPVPGSYQVAVYNSAGIIATEKTVPATAGTVTTTVTGLASKSKYTVSVWANGGVTAPPGASATFTTT